MFRQLVLKNRSYRRYDPSVEVPFTDLLEMVDNARLGNAAANKQPLKYLIVGEREKADALLQLTRWGAQLPNYTRPEPEERPTAFVVICIDTGIVGNPAGFATDVGIAAANLTLSATEKGLGCCMIGNFKPDEVSKLFSLPGNIVPQLVVAVGKPAEEIMLDEFEGTCPSTTYYRDENGVHHVPKRPLSEVLL